MTRNFRPVAGLILGVVLGSAVVQAHTWQMRHQWLNEVRLSELGAHHWHQESLRLRDQLAQINRQHEQKTFVQSVSIEVIKSPVPLIDVEAALEPYTEPLLGMPLSSVKLTLMYQLFEHRRLVLGDHLYQVEVKALTVSPEVIVLLQLRHLGRAHIS